MNSDNLFHRAADLIRCARHLVVLTGAGISTPSGIPDFRSFKSGLWGKANPFAVASLPVFRIRPQAFFDWIRPLVRTFLDALPNPAHLALAQLEQVGKLKAIITQNIDALHQKAGSKSVISVHGDYWTSHCLSCTREFDLPYMETAVREIEVPRCSCGGVIKPDVVFYGEAVRDLELATVAVASSDLLLVLGSTLLVYPAAFLPERAGGDVVVVNRGEVGLSPGPGRYFVDADLDEYFSEVARHLGN